MGVLAYILYTLIMSRSVMPVVNNIAIIATHPTGYSCMEARDVADLQQNVQIHSVQCRGKDGKMKSIDVR